MRRARWLLLAVALLVGAFLVTRPLGSDDRDRSAGFYPVGAITEGIGIGERAPELEATVGGTVVRLQRLDDGPATLAELRGGPVWIVFGATWCLPCREEAPILRDALNATPGGVTLLAVSIQETAETVRAYAQEARLPYPQALDRTGAVAQRYGIYGYPTHYLLNADGIVVARYFGPLNRAQVDGYLDLLLGGD